MNKNTDTVHKKSKIKKYVIFGLIICAVLAVEYFMTHQPAPTYPLGDKLEYVGASYSGTIPIDSAPSASYYYATDMSIQDIINYFEKAKLDDGSDFELIHPSTVPTYFSLKTDATTNPIDIYYYEDGSQKTSDFDLKQTSKKHLIIIQNEDYQAAKDSL